MFAVDLDDLLATVDDLAVRGTWVADLLTEVSRRVEALHVTWSGRAALAQAGAQADWEAGFRAMHDGLASTSGLFLAGVFDLSVGSTGLSIAANAKLEARVSGQVILDSTRSARCSSTTTASRRRSG